MSPKEVSFRKEKPKGLSSFFDGGDKTEKVIKNTPQNPPMNKRLKLIRAKTKISFMNTSLNKLKSPQVKLAPAQNTKKVVKHSWSPYSWRKKNKVTSSAEVELSVYKMLNFRLK